MSQDIPRNYYFVVAPFEDDEECSCGYHMRLMISERGELSEAHNSLMLRSCTKADVVECAKQIEELYPDIYFGVVGQKNGLGDQFSSFQVMPELLYLSHHVGERLDVELRQPIRDIDANVARLYQNLSALRVQDLKRELLISRQRRA